MISTIITLTFALLFTAAAWLLYSIYSTQRRSNIPGVPFHRSITQTIGRFQPVIDDITSRGIFKDFYSAWLGPIYIVLAVDPDAAKFVLKDSRFGKVGLITASKKANDYFGNHLLSKDGEDWRRHRALVNHGFTSPALTSYYPGFVALTEKAIGKLKVEEDIEITSLLSAFTLDILGQAIFNHDFQRLDGGNDKYYKAYRTIMGASGSSFSLVLRFFPILEKLPVKWVREYMDSLEIMKNFFIELMQEHKEDKSILANMLLGSELENKEHPSLSTEELLANVWLFFLAGHETTSTALTWALNCLREYPEVQEKLYQEIKEKIGDKIPTEEELNQLTYLDCFINEVLRLHSPVPALVAREATVDIPYKDKIIPKGSRVGVFFHILHTNPEYWDNPLEFRPERFSHENKKGRHHFVHIPFSEGPRKCLGTTFSLLEQRLFLTRLLQKYQVVDPVKSSPYPINKILPFTEINHVPIRVKERQ